MMMLKCTYRGYDIQFDKEKRWQIFLNGEFVCAQPSEEFAYKWVDEQKKQKQQTATQFSGSNGHYV